MAKTLQDAKAKAAKAKAKYDACAQKKKAKGDCLYPGCPGKGPFYTNCKGDYNRWKKAQEKAIAMSPLPVPPTFEPSDYSNEEAEEIESTTNSMIIPMIGLGILVAAVGGYAISRR